MKLLKYTKRTVVIDHVDEEGNPVEREVFTEMSVPDNENGRALAEKEAYGEITPYDDGLPEPVAPENTAPTWDELAAALQEGVDAV